jgi:hypothetical protein
MYLKASEKRRQAYITTPLASGRKLVIVLPGNKMHVYHKAQVLVNSLSQLE